MTRIYFTNQELEDLILNLNQCHSDGCLNYDDPAYYAMKKIEAAFNENQELKKMKKTKGQ